ncbi:HNH endonuclease [Stigmatella aurantiaca]|uniref:Endonuclease-like protein n=1 Tax=Stigmatella aurantiaca (strain DW4/3-1) TaxID=378806 RepID=E3FGG6_STIAD|nr:Endonuclease-like protein [Stigmatella aurantiaca DW4/3-1]
MLSNEVVEAVYDKCDGKCRYCGKKLSFSNYGLYGARGSWQIDYSRSRMNGGTNHMNNLFPACIPCNQEKGGRNGKSYIQARRAQNQHVPTPEKPCLWEWLFG